VVEGGVEDGEAFDVVERLTHRGEQVAELGELPGGDAGRGEAGGGRFQQSAYLGQFEDAAAVHE
jgi:hypothetical protein